MYGFLSDELSELYGNDKKKLRTNSVDYGDLGEGRWHSNLQPPLSNELINQFETGLKQEFPTHIDFRTKKIIKSYLNLKTLLSEILQEGKENMANGIYFEFE